MTFLQLLQVVLELSDYSTVHEISAPTAEAVLMEVLFKN